MGEFDGASIVVCLDDAMMPFEVLIQRSLHSIFDCERFQGQRIGVSGGVGVYGRDVDGSLEHSQHHLYRRNQRRLYLRNPPDRDVHTVQEPSQVNSRSFDRDLDYT